MPKTKFEKYINIAIAFLILLILFGRIFIYLIPIALIYVIYRVATGKPIMFANWSIRDFNWSNNQFNSNKINLKKSMETLNPKKFKGLKGWIALIVMLLIVLPFIGAFFVIVEAGETGVQSLFGKVRDNEFSSGFHLKNPLVHITKMNIRTQEYTMSISRGEGKRVGDDSIAALTKEGLQVDLDITVLYHLLENNASDVYREVGVDYDEVIIRPQIRSTIREIIAQFEAKDIYSEKRQEAAQNILSNLTSKLESRGILVEDVLLRNIKLPSGLAGSIQEKLQAEQDAERYNFILQKEEKEAERKRVEAAGQRDAQRIINESLTPRYLEFLYINSLKDREGTIYVPTSPNNGVPLFRGV